MSDQVAAVAVVSTSQAPTIPALDVRTLLARVNHRLALLRSWLGHDHGDEPWWWARHRDARDCQRERLGLRPIAHLLHVERATRRGRIHGTQFANLDEQRAWLDARAGKHQALDPLALGLPKDTTLQMIRDGVIPS